MTPTKAELAMQLQTPGITRSRRSLSVLTGHRAPQGGSPQRSRTQRIVGQFRVEITRLQRKLLRERGPARAPVSALSIEDADHSKAIKDGQRTRPKIEARVTDTLRELRVLDWYGQLPRFDRPAP